jgi:acetyl-CoA C-acetyltransferase
MSGRASHAYIQGAALQVGWADSSANLMEMIFSAVTAALRDSRVDLSRIDSVVLSAHDLIDGRGLSSMVTAPAAGSYLRDEIRLAEDGLAALSLAAARVESNETEYSIVAAWGRASEGDPQHVSRAAFDPFFVQPFGVDEFTLSAMRFAGWASRHGLAVEGRARAGRARIERAQRNPWALANGPRVRLNAPLKETEAPRQADIAVAMIIGRHESPVRLAGVGHSAEALQIGDRDLVEMRALRQAVERAQHDARVGVSDIDLWELAGLTLSDEAIALEAIGLSSAGCGFDTYADTTAINTSGGAEAGWCFPTQGLVNTFHAWSHLKSGDARRALATGYSPAAGQIAHAAVLEAV